MSNPPFRIGTGFDVHALVTGRPLIIGGVTIPYEKGLDGHSDADVLLHAITDAVLGALAQGDIGMHFPDTDPRWKGADSSALLAHVALLVSSLDTRSANIDATVVAQAPRFAPHVAGDAREHHARGALRRRLRVGEGDHHRAHGFLRARGRHRSASVRAAAVHGRHGRAGLSGQPRSSNAARPPVPQPPETATRAMVPPPSRGKRSNVAPCSRATRSTIASPSPAPGAPSARARAHAAARERLLQPFDVGGRDAGPAIRHVQHGTCPGLRTRSTLPPAVRRTRARCRSGWTAGATPRSVRSGIGAVSPPAKRTSLADAR